MFIIKHYCCTFDQGEFAPAQMCLHWAHTVGSHVTWTWKEEFPIKWSTMTNNSTVEHFDLRLLGDHLPQNSGKSYLGCLSHFNIL